VGDYTVNQSKREIHKGNGNRPAYQVEMNVAIREGKKSGDAINIRIEETMGNEGKWVEKGGGEVEKS